MTAGTAALALSRFRSTDPRSAVAVVSSASSVVIRQSSVVCRQWLFVSGYSSVVIRQTVGNLRVKMSFSVKLCVFLCLFTPGKRIVHVRYPTYVIDYIFNIDRRQITTDK